jgi:hypothetical protein
MGLDKRKRCAIGLGVLAIGALFADRVIFIPGPSSASAGEIPFDVEPDDPVDLEQLKALATSLASVCTEDSQHRMDASLPQMSMDPFESPWAVVNENSGSRVQSTTSTPDKQLALTLPELSAVVSVGGKGYAVLDGKPLALGASRDGYTLTELTDQAATISIRGSVFTIPLRHDKSSP